MTAQPSPQPDASSLPDPASSTSQTSKPTSIDLWNVPSLVQPSPPSNTLLITNLHSPHIFSAASLQHLYNLLNSPVALNSFAPLPSLRRIIISYPTIEAAVATRQLLEQSASLPTPPSATDGTQEQQQQQQPPPPNGATTPHITSTMKIYFGEPTPLVGAYADSSSPSTHLQTPSLGKLMFISPPPSPPCGWEVREEDPPNKMTHAEDLIAALAGLGGNRNNDNKRGNHSSNKAGRHEDEDDDDDDKVHGRDGSANSTTSGNPSHSATDVSPNDDTNESNRGRDARTRPRRGTLTVYHPRDHGDSEDLPAVMVEDMTGDADPTEPEGAGPLPTRTSRPPVELMDVC